MKNKTVSLYLSLFLTFMKIGAFTFGGGYAMISLIQKETVERRHWIADSDILDIVAIAESTPGPIAINASTFVGYKVAGFFGAFFATLGMILPSFLIIALLSFVLRQFESIRAVQYAFGGVKAGVLALILQALVNMYRQCPKSALSYGLTAAAFMLVAVLKISVLPVIVGCAAIGLFYSALAARRAGK